MSGGRSANNDVLIGGVVEDGHDLHDRDRQPQCSEPAPSHPCWLAS